MKSYNEILLERVNIRCAMWAHNLLTDEQLETFIKNCIKFAETLETGKSNILQAKGCIPYKLNKYRAETFITHFNASNQKLIEEYL